MNDYFEVFDLPRRLQVDLDALQQKFYELSRRHHPDFHQMAAPDEQSLALERSALVNPAYRMLSDPLSRLSHVIGLAEGHEEDPARKPKAPMDLLEEMLEVQEALEDAKASGLVAEARERLARERQRLIARQASGEAGIIG